MVEDYIARLDEPRRTEIQTLHELIQGAAPGLEASADARMIGYGPYHYRYASGREGDSHLISLASNKRYISVYVNCVAEDAYIAQSYRERLPNASIGKSCVRFKRTSDLDLAVLKELISEAARIGPPA
jgi:Domain of unknown function (DU1801)